jgi:hypothetical protein
MPMDAGPRAMNHALPPPLASCVEVWRCGSVEVWASVAVEVRGVLV